MTCFFSIFLLFSTEVMNGNCLLTMEFIRFADILMGKSQQIWSDYSQLLNFTQFLLSNPQQEEDYLYLYDQVSRLRKES